MEILPEKIMKSLFANILLLSVLATSGSCNEICSFEAFSHHDSSKESNVVFSDSSEKIIHVNNIVEFHTHYSKECLNFCNNILLNRKLISYTPASELNNFRRYSDNHRFLLYNDLFRPPIC